MKEFVEKRRRRDTTDPLVANTRRAALSTRRPELGRLFKASRAPTEVSVVETADGGAVRGAGSPMRRVYAADGVDLRVVRVAAR